MKHPSVFFIRFWLFSGTRMRRQYQWCVLSIRHTLTCDVYRNSFFGNSIQFCFRLSSSASHTDNYCRSHGKNTPTYVWSSSLVTCANMPRCQCVKHVKLPPQWLPHIAGDFSYRNDSGSTTQRPVSNHDTDSWHCVFTFVLCVRVESIYIYRCVCECVWCPIFLFSNVFCGRSISISIFKPN
jgi:hypothetical protein